MSRRTHSELSSALKMARDGCAQEKDRTGRDATTFKTRSRDVEVLMEDKRRQFRQTVVGVREEVEGLREAVRESAAVEDTLKIMLEGKVRMVEGVTGDLEVMELKCEELEEGRKKMVNNCHSSCAVVNSWEQEGEEDGVSDGSGVRENSHSSLLT